MTGVQTCALPIYWPAGAARNITWSAIDNIGVSTVDILLSRGGNAGPFDLIALGQPNTGSYLWRVSGPSTANAVVKVVANDPSGNSGSDLSDAVFAISALTRVTGPPTAELALFPVSPNPVRAASRFEFALPQDARVRLGLFDLLGRERAVLASGTFTAGAHSVDWDRARDGELVPGLYFLRMSAMGHTLAQRFVLMR